MSAIVVAAGRGERFGAPKQFLELRGARLVDHAVRAARAVSDEVVLVLPNGIEWDGADVDHVVPGGATRAASVRAGLGACDAANEVVVVHDAARPLATSELFEAVIAAVQAGADAAVPAVPVSDTIKRVDAGRVVATLPRDDLVAVQTPQAFRRAVLVSAHADLAESTDDAALVERAGGSVVVVPGEAANIKVTQPEDLAVARALLDARGHT